MTELDPLLTDPRKFTSAHLLSDEEMPNRRAELHSGSSITSLLRFKEYDFVLPVGKDMHGRSLANRSVQHLLKVQYTYGSLIANEYDELKNWVGHDVFKVGMQISLANNHFIRVS